MAIPGVYSLVLPLLEVLREGSVVDSQTLAKNVADRLQLTDDDLAERIQSGKRVFDSRFGWAKTNLKNAGLLAYPQSRRVQITPKGRAFVDRPPAEITGALLSALIEEQTSAGEDGAAPGATTAQGTPAGESTTHEVALEESPISPEERIDEAYKQHRRELEQDLLNRIMSMSPAFFEALVVDLIVKMGYGGTGADAARAIGRSGDGGIDGIIKEDRLGLDAVYLQAKRWANTVGRPEIQGFSGSLDGVRARKGVFITTSRFSREAREYVGLIDKKIALIDGAELAGLMIDYGVGVATATTYAIQKIDSDYFDEDLVAH